MKSFEKTYIAYHFSKKTVEKLQDIIQEKNFLPNENIIKEGQFSNISIILVLEG
jgi:hypothetical protein